MSISAGQTKARAHLEVVSEYDPKAELPFGEITKMTNVMFSTVFYFEKQGKLTPVVFIIFDSLVYFTIEIDLANPQIKTFTLSELSDLNYN
jgi:hypothetical protein